MSIAQPPAGGLDKKRPAGGLDKKRPAGELDKPLRGFAKLAASDPDELKRLAAKGAKRAHELGTAHEFTADEARIAGRKGGLKTQSKREESSHGK
jgi:hypothetical protein